MQVSRDLRRMTPRFVVGAALAIIALAGCGGGPSEEDQVRDAALAYIEDVRAERYADACQQSVAEQRCLESLMTAQALGVDPSSALPSDLEQQIRDADVTINGNVATIELADGEDGRWTKRRGEWLAPAPDQTEP
jgi:hypothetical protein